MERDQARWLAAVLGRIATVVRSYADDMREEGWHVSAQQLTNAAELVRDVERRLRHGDDWKR